jgi:tetratricopeptide (TPR) repeat protein
MPFRPEFDDVYMVIRDACADKSTGLVINCQRADEIAEPGKITDQILAAIESADALVADITGSNANVMYELGFATALKKQVILLNQSVEKSPFDVKDLRQIVYDRNRLVKDCRPRLVSSLVAILSGQQPQEEYVEAEQPKTAKGGDDQVRRALLINTKLVAQVAAIELKCQLANSRRDTTQLMASARQLLALIDNVSLVDKPERDDLRNFVGAIGNCAVELERGDLFQEAEDLWKRAIGLEPNHEGIHFQYSDFLVDRSRVEEAAAELKRGRELSPSDRRISGVETKIAIKGGKADPSVGEKLRSRFEANKTDTRSAAELLRYLDQTNAPASEFAKVCNEWAAALPDSQKWMAQRALADFLAGTDEAENEEKARVIYESLLADKGANEDRVALLHNLATICAIQDRRDEAKKYWTEAYRLDPTNPSIQAAFAQRLARWRDVEAAVRVSEGKPLE